MFSWFFETEPPPWYMWVSPAAGLFATWLALISGRLVLSRWRAAAPVEPAAEEEKRGPVYDPFELGSVTERRAAIRRQGNPIEVLISDAEATLEPARGWVIDRSMRGLCLLVHEEVGPGTVLSVKPRKAPPATPWVQAEVRTCKQDQAGYELGCQFVRTPPWAVMLLFG
jgi:hypothetical protein